MKYTIANFQKDFSDDEICLDYLFAQRFGHLEDYGKYYRVRARKCFAHSETGAQIYPLAGTIFHKSSTKLTSWFYAIFLVSQSRNGVSAKELERQLGVTYKTAWRMAGQIRILMDEEAPSMLSGTVEVDEAYIGGKIKTKARRNENKTPILGIVQRQGGVRALVVENVKAETVIPLLRENVEMGTNLMTDEYRIYNETRWGYNRQMVKHSKNEYVRGDVHTNTIEGFWGQLKRSINGTFHSVSRKHLQSYVNEFSFRYNHRNSDLHLFGVLLAKI